MQLDEAKEKFIASWGSLGSNWGVSRTMAQVHALLMISEEPMSAEDVMGALNISRGNTNMSIRSLIDWGLVEKLHKLGERKEFFQAEKDMWKVATRIARERRKRELAPIMSVLEQVKEVEVSDGNKQEAGKFLKQMNEIENFASRIDRMMAKLDQADERWFSSLLSKFMKR
ncbi:MAG: transcriptional regulator [Flavobacteriales bacterium]|nr:transcriptional regulator [Flavobacteriales bacterium]MDG1781760.1 transcriptional regulator [Flavobacteriales bacterium]MDG2246000.1 transcriptional regulator [Flavobacteriales bacterium]